MDTKTWLNLLGGWYWELLVLMICLLYESLGLCYGKRFSAVHPRLEGDFPILFQWMEKFMGLIGSGSF